MRERNQITKIKTIHYYLSGLHALSPHFLRPQNAAPQPFMISLNCRINRPKNWQNDDNNDR